MWRFHRSSPASDAVCIEYLDACLPVTLDQIVRWADVLFPGGFRLLQDDLCFPEDDEDWSERDVQLAYSAIGEALEREQRFY